MTIKKSFREGDMSPEDTELREATGKTKERREARRPGGWEESIGPHKEYLLHSPKKVFNAEVGSGHVAS